MKLFDLLDFARTALTRHGLRTSLSLLGVAIGVAAVVALSALGEGARRYVADQFSFLGSDLLTVLPGKVETSGGIPGMGGAANDLTLDDARALGRLPGVRAMAPVATGNETVSNGPLSRQVLIFGTTPAMVAVQELEMETGSFLPDTELERGGPVAVLGFKLARQLFPDEPAVGGTVRVGDWRMRVIGVLAERGMHMGVDLNEVVYVPVATAMRMLDRSSLFRVVLQLASHADSERMKRQVVRVIVERHDEDDVTCITPDAVLSSMSSILGVLTLALTGIAAISLTVAGIGIMNVMLVTVSERTSEVGLLKAVGARRRQILAIFLTEAAILSSAGGAVGLLASLGAVEAFKHLYPSFPAQAPVWALVAAMSVSVGVGLLFGVLPARRAAGLDPIQALARKQ